MEKRFYDFNSGKYRERKASGFSKILLYYILPYIAINGLIFLIVTSTPELVLTVRDTNDYKVAEVELEIKSFLPIKTVEAFMEDESLELEKQKKKYLIKVEKNGIVQVNAVSINGMHSSAFADISVLDDTPPMIDENNCSVSGDKLTVTISDSQSGVDFDSIYGTYQDGTVVKPDSINKETGEIVIPMETDNIEIHFEDMCKNERSANISANAVLEGDADKYYDYNERAK